MRTIDLKRFSIVPIRNDKHPNEANLIMQVTRLAFFMLKIVDAIENRLEESILNEQEMFELQEILVHYNRMLRDIAAKGNMDPNLIPDCLLDEDEY